MLRFQANSDCHGCRTRQLLGELLMLELWKRHPYRKTVGVFRTTSLEPSKLGNVDHDFLADPGLRVGGQNISSVDISTTSQGCSPSDADIYLPGDDPHSRARVRRGLGIFILIISTMEVLPGVSAVRTQN